jgi:hypothetical protein
MYCLHQSKFLEAYYQKWNFLRNKKKIFLRGYWNDHGITRLWCDAGLRLGSKESCQNHTSIGLVAPTWAPVPFMYHKYNFEKLPQYLEYQHLCCHSQKQNMDSSESILCIKFLKFWIVSSHGVQATCLHVNFRGHCSSHFLVGRCDGRCSKQHRCSKCPLLLKALQKHYFVCCWADQITSLTSVFPPA